MKEKEMLEELNYLKDFNMDISFKSKQAIDEILKKYQKKKRAFTQLKHQFNKLKEME